MKLNDHKDTVPRKKNKKYNIGIEYLMKKEKTGRWMKMMEKLKGSNNIGLPQVKLKLNCRRD